MALTERQITLAIVGGVLILALVYIASETTGEQADGTEDMSTQVGLGALTTQVNIMADVGAGRDFHEWNPGYDPVDSTHQCVKPRLRYPRIAGGNASTIIHHGFDAMRFPGVDGEWADAPPSEVSL
jgi:hypothetical protein